MSEKNFIDIPDDVKNLIFSFNRPDPKRLIRMKWSHMKYYFCRWRAYEVGNMPMDGFMYDQHMNRDVRNLLTAKFIDWCRNGSKGNFRPTNP